MPQTSLRHGRKAEALAPLAGLDPGKISSPERCQLAGLIHVGAEAWDAAVRGLPKLAPCGRISSMPSCDWRGCCKDSAASSRRPTPLTRREKLGLADPAAYYNQGLVLRALGRTSGATAAFDQVLQLRPAYPEALRAGAVILSKSGNTDGALKFIEEALRLKTSATAGTVMNIAGLAA